MLRKIYSLVLGGMLLVAGSANAGIADDLMALVNSGKTLADAVAQLVAADPAKAGDIVSVAADLVYRLSPERCALDEQDKPLRDCSDGIVASAIAAGGDPGDVTEAAAAGLAAAGGGGGGIAGGTSGGGGLTASGG